MHQLVHKEVKYLTPGYRVREEEEKKLEPGEFGPRAHAALLPLPTLHNFSMNCSFIIESL